MRKAKVVIRLKRGQNLSNCQIAGSCHIGVATVHDCLLRARLAGLTWPLSEGLTDLEIESRLYPGQKSGPRPQPDFEYIANELRRPKMTLLLLREEYRRQHPEGYCRSQFHSLNRRYAATLDPRMRYRWYLLCEAAIVIPLDVAAGEDNLRAIAAASGCIGKNAC